MKYDEVQNVWCTITTIYRDTAGGYGFDSFDTYTRVKLLQNPVRKLFVEMAVQKKQMEPVYCLQKLQMARTLVQTLRT